MTEARVRACAATVPITRLVDLTPLDRCRLPTFCAVTPLAADLTTHLGKGLDAVSARVSALMEAIERVSAERFHGPVRRASFNELEASSRQLVADPRWFDLPPDSSFRPARKCSWVQGFELLTEQPAWLPLDLVISPPQEGLLREVDTNGLASGNSLLEAALHGLGEVIERDALGQRSFHRLFAEGTEAPASRFIDPTSLPAVARSWLDQVVSADLGLHVEDITSDVEVATFKAVLFDDAFPAAARLGSRWFVGYGCAADAEAAVMRAITEAVQSRLAVIQGARDSFNAPPPSWRRATLSAELADLEPRSHVPFGKVPSFRNDDLLAELRFVLRQVRAAGFRHVFAAELTRPDLELPVVRVRVPGASSFLVNRRRVGWRCLRHLI